MMKNFVRFSALILFVFCLCSAGPVNAQTYYSKPTGDLHNTATWGTNPDGSGANPPDFLRTMVLANRENYNMTADWSVRFLVINAGSVLQIGSNSLRVGTVTGGGALGGTRMSNFEVAFSEFYAPGNVVSFRFAPGSNSVNNLKAGFYNSRLGSGSAIVTSALNVYGVVSANGLTFNLGDSLVLKSTASGTARLAPDYSDCNNCQFGGNIHVERYIPPRRAWRLLSAPLQGNQTINAAWQEGATTSSANPDPHPGFGTHITGGNAADGWDQNSLGAAPSIKTYNSATDTWVPVANTNATIVNNTPYLVFIRGDRSVPLGTNAVPATATTLRSTGQMWLPGGARTFQVHPQGFTAIPNPYATPINFARISRTNVANNFFVWDPKLGGEYGVGGWVVLNFNGGGYDPIPTTGSAESQYIQSGQAFMVRAANSSSTGSVSISSFSLSDGGGSDDVFRVGSDVQDNGTPFPSVRIFTNPAGLRVTLQTMNSDSSFAVVDEVLSAYGSNFSNRIDSMDARKPSNIQENLAISRDGELLMIERRQALDEHETIQLKLWNTAVGKKYRLAFNANGLNTTASTAYLSDSYLHTTTPIDLHQASRMPFSVHADPASANPYRFSIAFKAEAGAAVDRAGISMYPNPLKGKSIRLSFTSQPQGTYQVELVNGLGQVMHRTQINHAGGTAVQQVELTSRPAAGTYLLNIAGSSGKKGLKVMVD